MPIGMHTCCAAEVPAFRELREDSGVSLRWDSGKLEVAQDVACGPGQVAAELTKHFGRVVASDTNPEHVRVAERRVTAQGSTNCSVIVSTAENIFKHAELSSVDLIPCGEAIVLVDSRRFRSAAAKILKPKGTLVLWPYGLPYFLEANGELDEKVNKAYITLSDYIFAFLIRGDSERYQTPTTQMHCWFDDMAVGEEWLCTQRQELDHDLKMIYFSPDQEGMSAEFPPSAVGANGTKEEVIRKIGRHFWSEAA